MHLKRSNTLKIIVREFLLFGPTIHIISYCMYCSTLKPTSLSLKPSCRTHLRLVNLRKIRPIHSQVKPQKLEIPKLTPKSTTFLLRPVDIPTVRSLDPASVLKI